MAAYPIQGLPVVLIGHRRCAEILNSTDRRAILVKEKDIKALKRLGFARYLAIFSPKKQNYTSSHRRLKKSSYNSTVDGSVVCFPSMYLQS